MPVAVRYRQLARYLALAWLRTDDGERLPAAVYPAYANELRRVIERFVLGGDREGAVPTQGEFDAILSDLRFLIVQADPLRQSPIYERAIESLLSAEAAAAVAYGVRATQSAGGGRPASE